MEEDGGRGFQEKCEGSSGWKAIGKEVQGVPSEAPYSIGLPAGSVHLSKPKSEVPSQPRSPLLR